VAASVDYQAINGRRGALHKINCNLMNKLQTRTRSGCAQKN
jgi:hypothetical protein